MIGPAGVKQLARRSIAAAASAAPSRPGLAPSRWGLTIADDARLHLGDRALADLTAEHGSPLHVVDVDRLDREASDLVGRAGANVIAVTHRMVAVGSLIRRLHDHDMLGVVVSIEELERALAIGVDPGTLFYAEAAPSEASLAAAIAHQPRAVVVASPDTVEQALASVSRRGASDRPARLMVSVAGVESSGPIGGFDAVDAAAEAVARITAAPGAELAGIRITHDRAIGDRAQAEQAIDSVASVAGRLLTPGMRGLDVLLSIDLATPTSAPIPAVRGRLNRFAGVDLRAPDPDRAADIGDTVRAARHRLQRVAPARTRLVVEPGRALTASTQCLLATVLDVKDDGDPVHVVLDAGINLAEQTQDDYHHLFNASCTAGDADESFRFVGPICTPADVLYTNWRMPRIEIGDVLSIMDTGADFVATSTSFSFPRPAVIALSGSEAVVVRRAETFDDLIALDDVAPPPPGLAHPAAPTGPN